MTEPPREHDVPGGRPRPMWQKAAVTYVGLFVFSAVVFGAFQGAWHESAAQGLVSGLVFGLFMSAILGTGVVVGQRGNSGSWSPRRHATVIVPADGTVARRQTLVALEQLRARVTADQPSRLSARTGFSWKTWGTRIDVGFAGDETQTTVDLRIRPRVPTTLIDYGAANRTLDTLTFYLTPRDTTPTL